MNRGENADVGRFTYRSEERTRWIRAARFVPVRVGCIDQTSGSVKSSFGVQSITSRPVNLSPFLIDGARLGIAVTWNQ